MAAKEELLEELAHQKQQQETEGAERLRDWCGALERLFSEFRSWLNDATAKRLLAVEDERVSLREERLGAYPAPSLKVITPRGEVVRIVPKGRMVVGAHGRVDFECSPKKSMLVLKAADHWQFAELAPERGGWTFRDLSEESFWETLRYLLS